MQVKRAIGFSAALLGVVLAIVPFLLSDGLNEDHVIPSRAGRLVFALIHLPLFAAGYILVRRAEGKRIRMPVIDLLVLMAYATFRIYLAWHQYNMEYTAPYSLGTFTEWR